MLDKDSQKLFDELVTKGVHELTAEDIGFLRARRDYLSDQDRQKFASVLEVKKELPPQQPTSQGSDLKRPALMKEAKAMGLKFDKDVTAPQLRAMIDNANFEKEALEEEAQLKAEERKDLEESAKKLKIGFGSDTTNEELAKMILEAQEEKDPEQE